jgi:hypothetical protein
VAMPPAPISFTTSYFSMTLPIRSDIIAPIVYFILA